MINTIIDALVSGNRNENTVFKSIQNGFWNVVGTIFSVFDKKRKLLKDIIVSFNRHGITVASPNGESPFCRWHDIENIVIKTTDKGSYYEAAWWLISYGDKSIRIPNYAQGLGDLIDELVRRGANEKNIIEAIFCNDNKVFLIFEKSINKIIHA